MLVLINIILDTLKYSYVNHVSNQMNPAFKWVNLLDLKSKELSSDYLYVCRLSEAMTFNLGASGLFLLCLRDRIADSAETAENLSGMIIINENIDLPTLFNEVQNIFILLNDWNAKMQYSIIQNQGLQALLDLSEEVIGNHISILDPAFKLLAFTKNIQCDDTVTKDLIKYGYHTEETIRKFKLTGRLGLWGKTDSVIVNDSCDVSNCTTVGKAFTYSIQIVMLCNKRPLTDGLLDLFNILLTNMTFYVNRDYTQQQTYNYVYESFILDLIENKISDATVVMQRSKHVQIPFASTFSLFKISFSDPVNSPISRVLREVSDLLPQAKIILYGRDIVVLNTYDAADSNESSNRYIAKIQSLLEKHTALCGVSSFFQTLLQLHLSYTQASLALKLGQRLSVRNNFSGTLTAGNCNDVNVFKFEDYYLYQMIDSCRKHDPSISEMTFCCRALLLLAEYDRKHHLDNVKLLYTYLISERRATEAGALLHMHRNNIVYRISRIVALLGIDLNDPELRLRLLMAYKELELGS